MSITATLSNGQYRFTADVENMKELLEQATIQLVKSFDEAFEISFELIRIGIIQNIIPTVAEGIYEVGDPNYGTEGTLKAGFLDAWETNKTILRDNLLQSSWELGFNGSRMEDSVFKKGGTHYAQYHIRPPHPRSSYRNPSYPNTRPIDFEAVWDTVVFEFLREFRAQLKFRGWKFRGDTL